MTPLNLRSQLVQELPNLPADFSLTPVKDKRPFRKGWQTEPTIGRGELASLIMDGQMLWSDKHQREWRCYWEGYGIRTGQPSGGKLALDVDGITAVEILDRISGGDIPTTVSWTSGKVGREQQLYQLSDGLNARLAKIGFTHFALKEFGGFKCDGDEQLDFRYDRCQSVLPPSKHPDTGAYRWIHSPADVAVAAAPDWVEQFLNDYCDRYEQAI
ncbi:bifunctional DNA primase/polymerase, partial [Microcoleus sp. FACHB-1515]|uniref:bifunctional DNA primase/polymerase n=1 Tax=Cyanophyceae TaxID=3028117 RepID=UPI00168407B3